MRNSPTFPALGTAVRTDLDDLAARVERLCPSARHPERFHEDKSEIAYALPARVLPEAGRRGARPPKTR